MSHKSTWVAALLANACRRALLSSDNPTPDARKVEEVASRSGRA
jgi:hypothetical protein